MDEGEAGEIPAAVEPIVSRLPAMRLPYFASRSAEVGEFISFDFALERTATFEEVHNFRAFVQTPGGVEWAASLVLGLESQYQELKARRDDRMASPETAAITDRPLTEEMETRPDHWDQRARGRLAHHRSRLTRKVDIVDFVQGIATDTVLQLNYVTLQGGGLHEQAGDFLSSVVHLVDLASAQAKTRTGASIRREQAVQVLGLLAAKAEPLIRHSPRAASQFAWCSELLGVIHH